ncbi:MAG: hypothetical protein JST40_01170 [Armatimonadetes bacterium]|nr:hypothetical protein [Armatimonadota bacterium]
MDWDELWNQSKLIAEGDLETSGVYLFSPEREALLNQPDDRNPEARHHDKLALLRVRVKHSFMSRNIHRVVMDHARIVAILEKWPDCLERQIESCEAKNALMSFCAMLPEVPNQLMEILLRFSRLMFPVDFDRTRLYDRLYLGRKTPGR